tara:strand:- start:12731 stop:14827 length:2097 start_codon:yes stop_codon:yes gene_type:complete
MAKKYVVDLQIDGVAESVNNMHELESAVGSLEDQLKSADFGSEEFKRLSKELGVAKGELNVFQRQVDALDPSVKAEQFVKFAEGISGSIAVATGAMALFGSENKNLEKLMVKAQGAIAIAVGIRQIAESKLLQTLAQTAIGQGLLSAATTVYTFVTGAATTGLKLFRLALVSTGIGAIVVLVGILVANFDFLYQGLKVVAEFLVNTFIGAFNMVIDGVNWLIKQLNKVPGVNIKMISSIEKVSFAAAKAEDTTKSYAKSIQDLQKAQEDALKASQEYIGSLERELEMLEATGAGAEDILTMKRKILNALIAEALATETAIAGQLALAIAAREANKEMLARKAAADGKTIDEVMGELGLPKVSDIQKAYDDAKQARIQAEHNLKVFNANVAREKREKRKESRDKQKEDDDKAEEERLAGIESDKEKVRSEAAELSTLLDEIALMETEDAFERSALELEQKMESDLLKIENMENFEEMKLAIEDKYSILSSELKDKKIKYDADQKKIADAKDLATSKAISDAKMSIAQDGLKALSSIVSLTGGEGKRAKRIQKQIAVAQIAIDTAKSISATIAGASAASAAGGPAAPFLLVSYIASGIATVLGAVVSAKAALAESDSVEIEGDGGGGSGPTPSAGGGGGSLPQSVNSDPTAGIDFSFLGSGDSEDELGSSNFPPARAYVLESDVTSSQEATVVVEDQATL